MISKTSWEGCVMALTLKAILEAHEKYTGADFPKLIREIKLMGMAVNAMTCSYYDLKGNVVLAEAIPSV